MAESYVRFEVPQVAGLRDAQGRFTSAMREQRDLARDNALATQGAVVQRMRNHIAFGRRASASTGRLLRVTADPRNITTDRGIALGYGVGIPRYLDGSVAKYWRTFEEGSAAVWSRPFIGTQLIPVGRSKAPSAHGQTPGVRTTRGQAPPYLEGRYIVSKEIDPAGIYRAVAQEQEIGRQGVVAAVRLLNRVLAAPTNTKGGYFR